MRYKLYDAITPPSGGKTLLQPDASSSNIFEEIDESIQTLVSGFLIKSWIQFQHFGRVMENK